MIKMMYKAILLTLSVFLQLANGIDFLIRPSNKRVLVGMSVTLRCSFSNKGSGNTVYWYRPETEKYISNNENLYTQMPRYQIIGNTGEYSLQITNIQVTDEGEYRCGFFKNGMFTYARAVIVVLVTPAMGNPKCSKRPSSMLRPGDSVSLICQSSGGRPPASLRWFRGDQGMIGTSRISPNEIMTVLQPGDNGRKFVCKLTHETINAQRTCSIIPLKILPVVIVNPDALTVDVGQDASFRCDAEGIPRINKITWLVNNTLVVNGMHNRFVLRQNSIVLIIRNATLMDDNTVVTCRASTPNGLIGSDTGILFVIKGYIPKTTLATTIIQTGAFTTDLEEKDYVNEDGNNTKEILGTFFGVVLAFLIVATVLFITVRLCEKRKKANEMNMSQLRGNGSVYSMTNEYGPAPTVTDPDPSKYKTLGIEGKLPSVYQNLIENTTNPAVVSQISGYTNGGPIVDNLTSTGLQHYEVVVSKNDSLDDEDINDYETLGRDGNGIVGRVPPQRRYDTPASVLSPINNNTHNADIGETNAFDGTYEIPTAVKSQGLRKSDTLDSKGYVCPKQLYISHSKADSTDNLLESSCDIGVQDYVDMETKTRSIIYQQSIECLDQT
ncbi:cell adhesion molecule 2-like [Antedon mediterranea]|uniref:cell adhesion molecule 2-like n=1 Tax=Antedon mediterranea TaxID=105859 RepID=UPI003AF99472